MRNRSGMLSMSEIVFIHILFPHSELNVSNGFILIKYVENRGHIFVNYLVTIDFLN